MSVFRNRRHVRGLLDLVGQDPQVIAVIVDDGKKVHCAGELPVTSSGISKIEQRLRASLDRAPGEELRF